MKTIFARIKSFFNSIKKNRLEEINDRILDSSVRDVTIRRISYGDTIMVAIVVKNVVVYATADESENLTDKMLKIRDMYYAAYCSSPEIKML